MQKIYFIASYPRSGNTWVRSVLYELLRRQGMFSAPAGDLRPIDTMLPWDASPALYERVTGRRPGEVTPAMAAGARARVHQLLAETAPGPLLVKTHAAYGLFGRHPTINVAVTRGAVYLVRNPADVAESLAAFVGVELAEAVGHMLSDSAAQRPGPQTIWEPWSSWATNVRSWRGARDFPVLVVRYEDLRADPAGWMHRIAEHAGLAASHAEVAAVTADLTLDKMATMAKDGALTIPIRRESTIFVGSQRRVGDRADDESLAPLRVHAADVIRELGYDSP